MRPEQKRRPGRGGADHVLAGDLVSPFYISMDGETIAPLSAIIAAELDRRCLTVARAAKQVAHG
jgi:hypothetical protein